MSHEYTTNFIAEYNKRQDLLICMSKQGLVQIQLPPGSKSGYEYVEQEDGTHLVMSDPCPTDDRVIKHDFGRVVDRASSMREAINKAQDWRAVVAVMNS